MEKTERDPLVDPQPGDQILKGVGKKNLARYRDVVERDGHHVRYRSNSGPVKECWIATWWDWCKGATVTKRGAH